MTEFGWMLAVAGAVALYAMYQIERLINRRFDAIEKRLDALSKAMQER